VRNNFFDPAIISITAGQTVTWVWENEEIGLHNVLPDDRSTPGRSGEPESGPLTFSYTFTEVGTFRYYCQVHGALNGVGMSGRVIVQAAQP
jgi:plastocyanin